MLTSCTLGFLADFRAFLIGAGDIDGGEVATGEASDNSPPQRGLSDYATITGVCYAAGDG